MLLETYLFIRYHDMSKEWWYVGGYIASPGTSVIARLFPGGGSDHCTR